MTQYDINAQYTLIGRASATSDGKTVLPIIEVMNEPGVDDFFKDVPFKPCSNGLLHKSRLRTYRPRGTKRKVNIGVPSHTAQAEPKLDHLVRNEDFNDPDEMVFDGLENPEEERDMQDRAFIEGMGEQMVYDFFNADSAGAPEEMDGLLCRLANFSENTRTLVNANGTANGAVTSLIIVEWNPVNGAYGLMPSGPAALAKGMNRFGIMVKDLARQYVVDSNNLKMMRFVTQFIHYYGLCVDNQLKIGAIRNIDPLKGSGTAGGCFNENSLISILNHGHFDRARTRIYVNPTLKTILDVRAKDKGNVKWSSGEAFGKPVMLFHGVPVRTVPEVCLTSTQSVAA